MTRPRLSRLWGAGGLRVLLGDLAVIGVLGLVAAGLCAMPRTGAAPSRALVEVSGSRAAALDLRIDAVREFGGPRGTTRVEVRAGRVRIADSPCPLGVCVHSGWIGTAGQVLVCLPNEVVVRIPADRAGVPDAVSR